MTPVQKKIFYTSFFIKLTLACWIPLVADEYYYWLWGQNFQWSYFDHPPMVGWIMGFGDFFRSISPEAIRWPFVVLSQVSIAVWLQICKPFLQKESEQNLFLWVLLLNPLTGWGGLVASPDSPFLLFWSLSLWAGQRLVKTPSVMSYIFLGIFLGLGFLSKYLIVVFIPCLAIWILASRYWSFVKTPKVLVTMALGLFICLPVFLWNFENDWVSFGFQWKHGTGASQKSLKWPIEYIFGQIFLIFPIFIYGAFCNLKKATLLVAFGFVPLAFFFATSFFARVEANWPLMAFPAIYGLSLIGLDANYQKWIQRTLRLWILVLVVVLSTPLWFRGTLQQKYPLKIFESERYREALSLIDDDMPIYVDNYQKASFFSFHKGRLICKMPNVGRKDFFSFLPSCEKIPNTFYFITSKGETPDFSTTYPEFEAQGIEKETTLFSLHKIGKK